MTRMINLGIVAHVDAGKTTTTEQMLYQSGRIRTPGRVDEGTAHTDSLAVERARGISVRAAVTRVVWRDTQINLIDTPGHVDFSAEVERALHVLDAAVLVISAVDGVQAHTESLWRALRALGLPTLIYVNKLDRVGTDYLHLIEDLRKSLDFYVAPLQTVNAFGPDFASVYDILDDDGLQRVSAAGLALSPTSLRQELHSLLADHDDDLLQAYVDEVLIGNAALSRALWQQVGHGTVFPLLFGASLRGLGIKDLLASIVHLAAEMPCNRSHQPLSGVIFKMERDKSHGRVAYVRLFSGTLKNRDVVHNATRQIEEKVTQIRGVDVQSYTDTGVLTAGDVAAVYGLTGSRIGDVLGAPGPIRETQALSVALLTTQVRPLVDTDYARLADALQELDAEDPALSLQWLPEVRELHIRIMGAMQMEVLKQMIEERFHIAITYSPPSVIYKETPAKRAFGYVAYTMPKPCWAILRFLIEPLGRGRGLEYRSQVRTEDLLASYQHEVARRVPEALQQGMYGFEVTDLAITLVEGQHHVWHTHPLDFVVATPMAIMDGLRASGTQLLEPILQFRLSVPEPYAGRVLSDLAQMRAQFDNPVLTGDRLTTQGTLPLATSMDYALQLAMLTGGRGLLTTRFLEYREAPSHVTAEQARRGVNPLDSARYILAARSALAGS